MSNRSRKIVSGLTQEHPNTNMSTGIKAHYVVLEKKYESEEKAFLSLTKLNQQSVFVFKTE